VLQFAEEALDEVAFSVERLAEAGLASAIGLGRNVRFGALAFDQGADAIGIIGFVGDKDRAGAQAIEQRVGGRCVVGVACGEAEPNRQSLGIDKGVDLGRQAAARATETMISTPLFAVAAC
jgi:hypothetical protein